MQIYSFFFLQIDSRTSKCGEKSKMKEEEIAECVTFVLTHFYVFLDLFTEQTQGSMESIHFISYFSIY